MIRFLTQRAVVLVAIVGFLSTTASVHALAVLRISLNGGASWFTRTDGNDDGSIVFSGALGPAGNRWTLSGLTASTKPLNSPSVDPLLNGSATDPMMNLSLGSVSSDAAGVLLIEFSQTYYGPIQSGNTFTTSLSSENVGDGSTTAWSYLSLRNSGNNLFDKQTLLGDVSQTGAGANSSASSGSMFLGDNALFSMTTRIMVYHDGAGISSFSERIVDPPQVVGVPEGGSSVILLGLALLGLAGAGTWLKRRETA